MSGLLTCAWGIFCPIVMIRLECTVISMRSLEDFTMKFMAPGAGVRLEFGAGSGGGGDCAIE